jgi:membrane-bound ClpP family serine protease
LGAFFFLQQQQLIPNNLNWWALFLLVQGIVLLFEALTQRNAVHEMEMGKLVGGTILALIGLGFLLNLQGDLLPNLPWATIWPLFLIVGGVALLLRRSDQGGRSPN